MFKNIDQFFLLYEPAHTPITVFIPHNYIPD